MGARAKAPILEVGMPGEAEYTRLIESETIARYLEDAFPSPPMQHVHPARRAEGNMLVSAFMELVVHNYDRLLSAKSQADIDQAWRGMRRGLFATEAGLERYGTGTLFFGEAFGIVEALCAPFVIRMLINVKKHRGIDVLAFDDLPRTVSWMSAIRDHPSVSGTSPAEKSLGKIPPFLEPFFAATVSPDVRMVKPSSAVAAEAAFAASIDTGLVHKGKAPRDRSASNAHHSRL